MMTIIMIKPMKTEQTMISGKIIFHIEHKHYLNDYGISWPKPAPTSSVNLSLSYTWRMSSLNTPALSLEKLPQEIVHCS